MPSESRRLERGSRQVPRQVQAALAALAAAGLVAIVISTSGHGRPAWPAEALRLPARPLLGAAALCALMAVAAEPARRVALAGTGAAGLVAVLALAAAPAAALAALLLLVIAAGHASLPGRRSFAARVRAPAAGAVLLAGGELLLTSGEGGAARVGAAALAFGMAAVAGAVPFLQEFDASEDAAAGGAVWPGFIAPVLAVSTLAIASHALTPAARGAFEAVMVALGLVNAAWGAAGSWTAGSAASAWRHSFAGDWGLVLAGLGLGGSAGTSGAYLVLAALPAVRMPLYLSARAGLPADARPPADLMSVVAGVALAGAAPFAGFPARVLLIHAATATGWPLALVLGLLMIASVPGSLRLARHLGGVRARAFWVTAAALGISLAVGVYPAPLLAVAGLPA